MRQSESFQLCVARPPLCSRPRAHSPRSPWLFAHGLGERRSLGKGLADRTQNPVPPSLAGRGRLDLPCSPHLSTSQRHVISKAHAPTTEPPGQGHTFMSANGTVMALAYCIVTYGRRQRFSLRPGSGTSKRNSLLSRLVTSAVQCQGAEFP